MRGSSTPQTSEGSAPHDRREDLPAGKAHTGYKEQIDPDVKATLRWDRDLVFTGLHPQGCGIEFDANARWGCKPAEALLLSLAGCMGVDIVMILQKMRAPLTSFRMELTGRRNATPPQCHRSVEIVLSLAGKGLDPARVERAISLSRTTYCCVFNSLRGDLELDVRHEIAE